MNGFPASGLRKHCREDVWEDCKSPRQSVINAVEAACLKPTVSQHLSMHEVEAHQASPLTEELGT